MTAFKLNEPVKKALENKNARLLILEAADRYGRKSELPKYLADEAFCAEFNAGKTSLDPQVFKIVKSVTARTVARWRALVKSGLADSLAIDRGAPVRSKGTLDNINTSLGGAVKKRYVQIVAPTPKVLAAIIYAKLQGTFSTLPDLPLRTIQSTFNRWNIELAGEIRVLQSELPNSFDPCI